MIGNRKETELYQFARGFMIMVLAWGNSLLLISGQLSGRLAVFEVNFDL